MKYALREWAKVEVVFEAISVKLGCKVQARFETRMCLRVDVVSGLSTDSFGVKDFTWP
jgi:hypothetical protein